MDLRKIFNAIGVCAINSNIPHYVKDAIQQKVLMENEITELALIMGSKQKALDFKNQSYSKAIQQPYISNFDFVMNELKAKRISVLRGE